MTETHRTHPTTAERMVIAPTSAERRYGYDTDDWTSWINFAGILMFLLGLFQAVQGLVALTRPDFYVVSQERLVVSIGYTGWGWVHLLIGVFVLVAGLGVLAGQLWARIVGIALTVLSAMVNLAFLPAYPMWSVIVILVDIGVIYALTTDRRADAPRGRAGTASADRGDADAG